MDVLGDGVERREVAGVIGGPWVGRSLRLQPQSTVDRSKLRFRLAPKTCNTTSFAEVLLQTFVATAYGSRFTSARAVTNGALMTLRELPSHGPVF